MVLVGLHPSEVLLGVLRVVLVVLHPSEELPEDPVERQVDPVGLHPSEVLPEDPAERQVDPVGLHPLVERLEGPEVPLVGQVVQVVNLRPEALAGLHPSEERRVGQEGMLGVHWGVDQGVLQKHQEVVLKRVDLRLREGPVVQVVGLQQVGQVVQVVGLQQVGQVVQVVGLQQVGPVV